MALLHTLHHYIYSKRFLFVFSHLFALNLDEILVDASFIHLNVATKSRILTIRRKRLYKTTFLSVQHDDVMMDHALRTVCFICDIGNIMVLMSRRLTTDLPDLKIEDGSSLSLANIMAEKEKRTSKNICHIFECEEVS